MVHLEVYPDNRYWLYLNTLYHGKNLFLFHGVFLFHYGKTVINSYWDIGIHLPFSGYSPHNFLGLLFV